MKTGTRWAIPVVSYNRIYQTWSINGCLRYYDQGRTQNLMWVGSFQEKVDLFDGAGVQSTQHAKHAKARGSGGMPPRKILKNRYQNTGFGDISAT